MQKNILLKNGIVLDPVYGKRQENLFTVGYWKLLSLW